MADNSKRKVCVPWGIIGLPLRSVFEDFIKQQRESKLPHEIDHGWLSGELEDALDKPYPFGNIKCVYCDLEMVQIEAIKMGPQICPGRDRRKNKSDRRASDCVKKRK